MTEIEAYERACALWGQGVAWKLSDRVVVGRWVPVGEKPPHSKLIRLRTATQGCEVMGEGATWEEAFEAAERAERERSEAATENGVAKLVDVIRRSGP